MLYETLMQPIVLFWVVVAGFFCGVFFDVANWCVFALKQKTWARVLFDVLATVFCGGVFFLLILYISYGQIRIWQILCFGASLCVERLTIGKTVAKFGIKCYNFFHKKFDRIKEKKQCQLVKKK